MEPDNTTGQIISYKDPAPFENYLTPQGPPPDSDVQTNALRTVAALYQAGWRGQALKEAFLYTYLESNHLANVYEEDNTQEKDSDGNLIPGTGTASYGLFQINPDTWDSEYAKNDPDTTSLTEFFQKKGFPDYKKELHNTILVPEYNAEYALKHIYHSSKGVENWSTWLALQQILDDTRPGVQQDALAKYPWILSKLDIIEPVWDSGRPLATVKQMEATNEFNRVNDLSKKEQAEKFEGLSGFSYSPNGYSFNKSSSTAARRKKVTDDYLDDHVSTELEQEDIFEPNFVKNPKGGAMGAIENMRQ
tara:strand:+ start:102 stop:1016 length:915 start_codon:yes stop_codon:yes gene_type:complete